MVPSPKSHTNCVALAEEKAKKETIVVDIAKRWRNELEKYRELLVAERQREESQNKFAQMEHVVARDSKATVSAKRSGRVMSVDADRHRAVG